MTTVAVLTTIPSPMSDDPIGGHLTELGSAVNFEGAGAKRTVARGNYAVEQGQRTGTLD